VTSRTWRVSHTVGLPSNFLYTPNTPAHPKSFEIWPTSLVEGERPGGALAMNASAGEPKERESA